MKKIFLFLFITLISVQSYSQYPYKTEFTKLTHAGTITVSVGIVTTFTGFILANYGSSTISQKLAPGLCIAGGTLITASIPIFACSKRKTIKWWL